MKKLLLITSLATALSVSAQDKLRDTVVGGDTLQIRSVMWRGKIKYYNCWNPVRKTTSRILVKKP